MKNKEGFAAMGVKNPMALMSKIKNGETIELPDGSFIYPSDVVGPPKLGRKIVILGDTSNPSSLFPLLSRSSFLFYLFYLFFLIIFIYFYPFSLIIPQYYHLYYFYFKFIPNN